MLSKHLLPCMTGDDGNAREYLVPSPSAQFRERQLVAPFMPPRDRVGSRFCPIKSSFACFESSHNGAVPTPQLPKTNIFTFNIALPKYLRFARPYDGSANTRYCNDKIAIYKQKA